MPPPAPPARTAAGGPLHAGKKRPAAAAALLALAVFVLAAGCATEPALPRPGETWRVSTETLALRERPDALSPATAELRYGDAVLIQKDVRVAPPFSGDRKLFPEDLLPCWSEVSADDAGTGYVPVPSLASEWLMENQDPSEEISADGLAGARRGFSESETDEELASMRGAAGKGKAAAATSADREAVERALAGRHRLSDADMADFLEKGGLKGRAVAPETLEIEARGTVSKFLLSAKRATGGAVEGASQLVASRSSASTGKLVAASGKAAKDLAFSEIGPVQEFQMGKTVAARIFPLYEAVDPEDRRAVYVASVGGALARASNDPEPYGGYVFSLVESDEVNAFAVPGGFVFVTTGMLDFLRDEDELAAILGHEMGHAELRHGTKSVGTEKILRLLSLLKEAALTGDGGAQSAASPSGGPFDLNGMIDELFGEMLDSIRNGYGVEIESQADWRSLQLCKRLGYDTMALYEVLERFKETKGSYGGASYPAERGADILKYREQLGYGPGKAPAPGRAKRARRYRETLNRAEPEPEKAAPAADKPDRKRTKTKTKTKTKVKEQSKGL